MVKYGLMNKKKKLENLRQEMKMDHSLPLREGAIQLVFGEGSPDADIYFLAEAPGRIEDKTGRPFAGPAGKVLDKALESVGIKRGDVYITSVIRYRPPKNRLPKPEEIAAFAPYVDVEISIIDPKIIVTLGKSAMEKFLPEARISEVHGQIFKIKWYKKDRILIPMYHPAAALRRKDVALAFKKDFRTLKHSLRPSV